jgi:hypothetical protein
MRDWTKIGILAVLCAVLAVPAFGADGEYRYFAADTCPTMRVQYNGNETATFANSTSATTIVIDTTTTTITYSGMSADEAGVLQGSILGAPDDEGDREMKCVLLGALSADAVDGLVIATTTFTMKKGVWYEVTFWDTSGKKNYDTVFDSQRGPVNARLTGIYGLPTGTGAVTVSAYIGGVLAGTWSYPTTWPTGQATNVADIQNPLEELGGLYAGERIIHVRAARATTATTGGIGIVVRQE